LRVRLVWNLGRCCDWDVFKARTALVFRCCRLQSFRYWESWLVFYQIHWKFWGGACLPCSSERIGESG
jgi:hypothetical protein